MRLIDLNVLLELVKKNAPFIYSILLPIAKMCPVIYDGPIVRCEDCKHHSTADSYTGKMLGFHFCHKFGNVTKNTDFCSYGERRKDHAAW